MTQDAPPPVVVRDTNEKPRVSVRHLPGNRHRRCRLRTSRTTRGGRSTRQEIYLDFRVEDGDLEFAVIVAFRRLAAQPDPGSLHDVQSQRAQMVLIGVGQAVGEPRGETRRAIGLRRNGQIPAYLARGLLTTSRMF